MAKLNKENAEAVDNAPSGFEPVPARAYHLRLMNVDSDRSGPKGPYWSWEYEIVEDHEYEEESNGKKVTRNAKGRKLWNNTSLAKESAFAMKQTFDAFGVPTDTDTDDLCGQVVKGIVGVRTIQQGPRKGELANQIERLVPKDEDFEVPEAEASPSPEDIFD